MKILLAGDSTMADKPVIEPYDFARCYRGWGQVLRYYVAEDVPVRNFAVNGYTVEAFRSEGTPTKYEQLLSEAAPGDFVLLQFGHNDQKRPHLQARGGYAEGLRRYIDELRARQLHPVVVTPLCRNSWRCDDGSYSDLLAEYARAAADTAAEKSVPLLDLHEASLRLLTSMGREKAKRYFYPGDYTHTNGAGGLMAASLVAGEIMNSRSEELLPLRRALLPEERWPSWQVEDALTDPATGWAAPPPVHTRFDFLRDEEAVTRGEALRMAREGYAWFVYVHTGASGAEADFRCAQENGYLPDGFSREKGPDEPCSAELLKQLMTGSCAGRNVLTPAALALEPARQPDGTVTGRDARAYALRLERLTSGTSAETQVAGAPAGS